MLEFTPYPFKHWNPHLIVKYTGIVALALQTLEFAPNSFKH